jgi:hypothetical protein
VLLVAAALAVWVNRETMLTHGTGATDVLHTLRSTNALSGPAGARIL